MNVVALPRRDQAAPEPTRRPDDGRLLSLEEVAEILGVARKTLLNWRAKGEGPTGLRIGRKVRYRRSTIEAWIDAQQRETGR